MFVSHHRYHDFHFHRLRDIDRAWTYFTNYTKEYIRDTRLAENSQGDNDGSGYILRRLIDASREDAGKYTLTEDEVVSLYFSFIERVRQLCITSLVSGYVYHDVCWSWYVLTPFVSVL